ncbi:MAG: permease-like cell division protein FtsX [Oscillospiraceae bacterium]|jgi:cell division transport system permease protein|nr:permease-like cell division protein FtsX [Oscillospiraceae bacterium]
MKSNRAAYYIKEGFVSIFTHGLMSFASVCIIVACLIIMGSFTLLAYNVSYIIGQFENENIVLAYVDESLSEAVARGLETQIRAVPNVASAAFVSREEAMESFVGKYENKSLFEGIGADVFRHRFVVYVKDIELTAYTQSSLLGIAGIEEASANLSITRGLVTMRNIVSGVTAVLAAVLLIISLFIMSNTIRLGTFERRDEIAIMKMVGATNSFIRWPFIVEGFMLGTMGALVAYIAQWLVYTLITDRLTGGGRVSFITAAPFQRMSAPIIVAFLAIGILVGVVGSSMAIRKYLKV